MAHKNWFTPRRLRQVISIAVALALIGSITYLGLQRYNSSHAADGATMYLSPKSGTVQSGDKITVMIREDSGTQAVNAIQSTLTYDSEKLTYDSMTEGSVFTIPGPPDVKEPGLFRVVRGTTTPVTGDQPILSVTFTVTATSGTVDIKIDKGTSQVVRTQEPATDILEVVKGGTYTVQGAPSGTPPIFVLAPDTASYKTDQDISVAVRIVSPDIPILVTRIPVTYPSGQLEYTSYDVAGGAFTAPPIVNKIEPGLVDLTFFTPPGSPGITGDKLIFTIKFKVTGTTGTAVLAYGSAAYASDGTGDNLLNKAGSRGANYAISSDEVAPPPPPPPPGGGETPPPPPPPGGGGIGAGNGGSASNHGDSTEVSGEVELAPIVDPGESTDDISKVEYYLNGKLIATKTSAPFKYSFDTTKLRNGAYTVLIKTYNKDGTVGTITSKMVVKNAVTLSYILRHYALTILGVLVALALLGFALWKYVLPRIRGGGGNSGNGLVAGTYVSSNDFDKSGLKADKGIVSNEPTTPDPTVVSPSGKSSAVITPTPTLSGATPPVTEVPKTVTPSSSTTVAPSNIIQPSPSAPATPNVVSPKETPTTISPTSSTNS